MKNHTIKFETEGLNDWWTKFEFELGPNREEVNFHIFKENDEGHIDAFDVTLSKEDVKGLLEKMQAVNIVLDIVTDINKENKV